MLADELERLRTREVQMLHAAFSKRNWHEAEDAGNQLRDKLDRILAALRHAEASQVEKVARAICKARDLNPDCLYQHNFEGDWPEDERREFSDALTGEPRVQLFHRAWRHWEKAARAAIAALPANERAAIETYAEWQQRRGMLADKVDWAINEYDEYMKDDAYDAQAVLDRIIGKLREFRALSGSDHMEQSLVSCFPSAPEGYEAILDDDNKDTGYRRHIATGEVVFFDDDDDGQDHMEQGNG